MQNCPTELATDPPPPTSHELRPERREALDEGPGLLGRRACRRQEEDALEPEGDDLVEALLRHGRHQAETDREIEVLEPASRSIRLGPNGDERRLEALRVVGAVE